MNGILDKFRLDGKVAIVTGASRGLGQGMATGLAEAGADIVAVATTDCRDTRRKIEVLHRRCVVVQADLGKASAAETIAKRTVKEFGRLDILVNNAGIIRRGGLLDITEKDWDDVMDVNIKAVFLLCQAAVRRMIRQGGGKIINIASMMSFQGGIRICPYTVAKSGIVGLTRLMANELASQGINVNAIAPGYMATDLTKTLQADKKRNADILIRIPAGRWGIPDDLKGAVVFLASSASDYFHGATLSVDGGWLAR